MTRNINEVSFMRKAFLPVLPLVYDDALSYIEFLGKVCDKCNEIIEAMNELDVEILARAKEYTDGRIEEVYLNINNLKDTLENEIEEQREDILEFKNYVSEQVDYLVEEVNSFYEILYATENAINQRTDMVVRQNNEYLLEEMSKFMSNTKVVNFITGEEMTVQNMFNFLCMYHLTDPLTYTGLANKGCTYTTLASYDMTYTELVTNGNTIIV